MWQRLKSIIIAHFFGLFLGFCRGVEWIAWVKAGAHSRMVQYLSWECSHPQWMIVSLSAHEKMFFGFLTTLDFLYFYFLSVENYLLPKIRHKWLEKHCFGRNFEVWAHFSCAEKGKVFDCAELPVKTECEGTHRVALLKHTFLSLNASNICHFCN